MSDYPTDEDLKAAKLAMDDINGFTYSTDENIIDANGITRLTFTGVLEKLGYLVPIAYASGIVFTAFENTKTIEVDGKTYAPHPSSLPFTTSGTFTGDDDSNFYLVPLSLSDLTPEIVGLGNVDNTSDIDKPISTLTQDAFDNLTPNTLGLGNVDNTADVDKPISTLTQDALDGKLDGRVSRYYQIYNGTSSFGEFATPVIFTGDFTVEIEAIISVSPMVDMVLTGDSANENWIRLNADGTITAKLANASNGIPSSVTFNDDIKHKYKFTRTDTTLEYFVDEISQGTDTCDAGTVTFNYVGQKGNVNFLEGTPANAIFTDDESGETLTFSLTETDIEYSNESSEKLTNPNFDTDTDWTKGLGWTIANGVASSDGTSTSSALYQDVSLSEGVLYDYTFSITGYVSGDMKFEWDSNDFIVVDGDGTYTGTFTPDSSTINRPLFRTNYLIGFVGSIDSVSIRQTTNSVTFTDITTKPVFTQEYALNFSPATDMIADTSLSEGDWAKTSGLLTTGDGGGDNHLIVSSSSVGGHVLDNGLIAVPQTLADRQINHPERRLPRKLFKKLYDSTTAVTHLNIVSLGDSLGGQKMYMMASNLDRKFGGSNDYVFNSNADASGAGAMGGGNTLYPTAIVSGEAETGMYDYWFTGNTIRLDDGGSSLFIMTGVNPTCEVVEVYYVKEPGSGSISLSIDSVVVATEDADDTIGMGKISWTKTLAQEEVKLSVTGGSVRILFVQATTPSVSGVNFYNRFMTGGLALSDPMGSSQCVDIVSSVLADIDPDLITFEFDDTDSDITTGFVTLKSILETETPYADKLLISSNPRSTLSEIKGNSDVYLRTQAAISNKSWLTFDAYNSVGSYEEMTAIFGVNDGVHPNVAAHAFWASALWNRLGLNSDLMGFSTRAVLDASVPSRLGDGTVVGGDGNGVLQCINKPPRIERADLVGGDFPADSLIGAIVRCPDGNAGDGLYIAVGANDTDWQLITTSGLV